MSPVVIDVREDVLALDEIERAFHGPDCGNGKSTARVQNAQLTITRNSSSDFQDRQVYLFVDEQEWGKVKYGKTVSREIPPGRHQVRAFNTLFSHTIEITALPGEHVRLNCTNGMPTVGWLMMIVLHVTALRPRLERV